MAKLITIVIFHLQHYSVVTYMLISTVAKQYLIPMQYGKTKRNHRNGSVLFLGKKCSQEFSCGYLILCMIIENDILVKVVREFF